MGLNVAVSCLNLGSLGALWCSARSRRKFGVSRLKNVMFGRLVLVSGDTRRSVLVDWEIGGGVLDWG